jgi:hypothetical protein
VNWDAYTHEELYRMLWQDADVGDVSEVAGEWRRHSAALADQADQLRRERTALLTGWSGDAAEQAAAGLGALAERLDGISARAAGGYQAAQEAADALAFARAVMPAPSAPTPSGFSLTFGAPASDAFGSVATGTSSLYFGSAAETQAKSQAVYAMQGYESSLAGSLIPSGGTAAAHAYGSVPPVTGGGQPGVPWERLVGRAPVPLEPGPATGGAVRVATAGPSSPGPSSDPVAARAAGQGLCPPVGQPVAGDDDVQRQTRLPVIDQNLFTVTEPLIAPVIGIDDER